MADTPTPWRPQKLLVPCLRCGLTVLRGTWNSGDLGGWTKLDPVQEPISGDPHDCALALIRYAARWQYIVALMPRRTKQETGAPTPGATREPHGEAA